MDETRCARKRRGKGTHWGGKEPAAEKERFCSLVSEARKEVSGRSPREKDGAEGQANGPREKGVHFGVFGLSASRISDGNRSRSWSADEREGKTEKPRPYGKVTREKRRALPGEDKSKGKIEKDTCVSDISERRRGHGFARV